MDAWNPEGPGAGSWLQNGSFRLAVKGPGVNAKKCPFSGEKSGLCLACDAACRWMRGTLRAQVRPRSFRTVRLGFLTTSRAPQNTPRVPLKGTRGVLHRAILTDAEKCHLNPTQHAPTTRYAPGARSRATGALVDPKTPRDEYFGPILTPPKSFCYHW